MTDAAPRIVAQDLSRDPLLANAPRADVGGKLAPVLGRIRLLAKIGRGGASVVYYGIHPRLDVEVAVKILPFHLAEETPDLKQRFLREAKMAAKVKSEHLVAVIDVDEDNGIHFLVMEYVNGPSAGAYLKQAKQAGWVGLPETEALDICIAATQGLAAAHTERLVHRDVKPDNILIPRARGTDQLNFRAAKLTDLGLVHGEDISQSLTGSGVCMGTPGYMSPEQAMDARHATKASDVFSMGAALYALLAGRPPFTGSALMKILLATRNEPHEPMRRLRPEVSAGTARLLDRCLAKDPARRYPTAGALLEALQACRLGSDVSDVSVKPSGDTVTLVKPSAGLPPQGAVVTPHTLRGGEPVGAEDTSHAPKELALDFGGGVKLQLVLIPTGRFSMGSPADEPERDEDETQHEVTFTRPFYLGRYAVTQEQYERITGINPSYFKGAKNPVEQVSWDDTQMFCRKVGGVTGQLLRLPTEAEWEYACRAGTTTAYYAGHAESDLDRVAWYIANSKSQTHPVGQKRASAWGLYDMHGNVWEWCQDWYAPYRALPAADPQGPAEGQVRVVRGGAYYRAAKLCRAAHRGKSAMSYRYGGTGFRVVVELLPGGP